MPDNLPDLIEDATLAFHGEDHDAFRAAAARLAMPLIAERDKLAAELGRLRAQAERYRLDALRLAAQVDPEEFAAEWEAEIADLRTVREDLANERAVRAVQAGKLAEIRALCRNLEGIGIDPVTAKEVWAIIDRPMPEGGA